MAWTIRIAMGLLLGLGAGCAVTPAVQAERDALAVFNRCVVAQRDLDHAMQEACLSKRLRDQRKQETAPGADPKQLLEATRDTRPYRTQVQSIAIAEDLNTATLETLNYSGVLDQKVEHRETIVLVREYGRWVVDHDCCEYKGARLLDESGKPIDNLPPSPKGDLMPQTQPLPDLGGSDGQ